MLFPPVPHLSKLHHLATCEERAHKTVMVHQTRQKGAVRPMEGPDTWGKKYLWPLHVRGACCHPRRQKLGTFLVSILSSWNFYSTPDGTQILVLRFPHFLLAPFQRSWKSKLWPQSRKSFWVRQRVFTLYLFCVSLQDPRESHLWLCRTNRRLIAPVGLGGFSTLVVDRILGDLADTRHQG